MRYYSSTAGEMELQADITAASASMTVDSTTGLPGTTPFTVIIDPGTASEEIVDVTNVSGLSLTISRGVDGSPAQSHSAGAKVRHMASARDFREAQEHINSDDGVHGVSGDVVGTTDAQVLSHKDLSSATNTFPSSLATDAELSAHTSATAAHGATGAVVGTTNTQSLSNKDLTSPTNTFPSSLATDAELTAHTGSTAAHGATGAVVGTTNSQTLTNKTMSGSSNTFSNIPVTAVTNLSSRLAALESFPGWTNMSGFASGMSSDATSRAQYRRTLMPDGSTYKVELRGRINHSSTFPGSGVLVVTLPSGYRPDVERHFSVARSFASANTSDARITIFPSGQLWIYTPAGETSWFALDGVYFYTE